MALFKVLARGLWKPKDIIIVPHSSFHRLPPEYHIEMETFWQEQERRGHFNGRMLRLNNYQSAGQVLHLELSTTDYQALLFSNEYTDRILSCHGPQALARALGVSAVVKSSDEHIIFLLRSGIVGEFPHCHDFFGGHIDADLLHDPHAVFTAIQRELAEEAGLEKNDYSLHCFALIEALDHRKPELLFVADSQLTAAQIIRQARSAVDRQEYEKLLCLANAEKTIREFMERNENITPSAVGCLEEYIHWMQNYT